MENWTAVGFGWDNIVDDVDVQRSGSAEEVSVLHDRIALNLIDLLLYDRRSLSLPQLWGERSEQNTIYVHKQHNRPAERKYCKYINDFHITRGMHTYGR